MTATMTAQKLQTVYSLKWQSPLMAAPAFWYYRSQHNAINDALMLQRNGNWVDLQREEVSRYVVCQDDNGDEGE